MHIMDTIKCIGTVLAVGVLIVWFGQYVTKNERCMKKKARRTLRNLENLMDDVHYLFK